MHRIRFAFCALALIGMAAPASAQGPIRNWLRSRRPTAEPQNVMPAPTVTTGTTATTGTGTTATVGAKESIPTGPVAGGAPAATTPGKSTSNYAPAGTSPVTPAAATTTTTTMGVPTQTYTTTGRRGLIFGRRRGTQPVYTEPTGPMAVPAPSGITPMPGGTTPKP